MKKGTFSSRHATLVGPVFLAVLVYSGQLKQNPLLEWVPGDLTLIAAAVVIVASIVSRLSWGPPSRYLALPYILWLLFLPAVALMPNNEYSESKVFTLFTITLLLAVAPFYILRKLQEQAVFLGGLVVISTFVSVYAFYLNRDGPSQSSMAIVFDGADTIGTSRMALTGTLVCLIFAMRAKWGAPAKLLLLAFAVLTATLAVFSGSRGPLVSVIVALIIIILSTPAFKSRRSLSASVVSLVAVLVVWRSSSGPSGATSRAFSVFTGATDSSTNARIELWDSAFMQFIERPMGRGWGGYDSPLVGNPYPHNIVLEIGVEAGIIVSCVVLAFVIATILRGVVSARTATQASMVGLLLFGIFSALVSSDINGARLLVVSIFTVWAMTSPVGSVLEERPRQQAPASY